MAEKEGGSMLRHTEGFEHFKKWLEALQGKDAGWDNALCLGWCSDPTMAAYGCCCSCFLAWQISVHNGKNGIASCLCAACCPCYHMYAFQIPDRMEIGGGKDASLLHGCIRAGSCPCGMGPVQVAKQAGLKPFQLTMTKK